jgi:hypothetical protein
MDTHQSKLVFNATRFGAQTHPVMFPPIVGPLKHRHVYPRKQLAVWAPNPRLRTPRSRESVPAAASKPHWNWQEFSLPESSPRKCARIALQPDTVRPAHGAAIVDGERYEITALTPAFSLVVYLH